MKTKYLIKLLGLLSVIAISTGCVVHEHTYSHPRGAYYHDSYHHVHGPGCGHVMRGGVWVVIP